MSMTSKGWAVVRSIAWIAIPALIFIVVGCWSSFGETLKGWLETIFPSWKNIVFSAWVLKIGYELGKLKNS